MGRSFLVSTLLINQNVADQRMRVEGMRDGEMALLLSVEGQDKRQLPQIQLLHEMIFSFAERDAKRKLLLITAISCPSSINKLKD